jgi:hypothetical protein
MAGGKRLAVIILHGIGTYSGGGNLDKDSFDTTLRDSLKKRLGAVFDRVAWQRVVWSDAALERRQTKLIEDRGMPWPWKGAFDFVSSFLSDASAYTLPVHETALNRSSYHLVQKLVRGALIHLESELGADAATTPVLAIAHSMGCHVLSCYAWDALHKPERILGTGSTEKLSDFQALKTLSGLIYVGCNLPLLTMNVPEEDLLPIRLPLRPVVLGGAESVWLNMWEANDLLGYPIAPQYGHYFGGTHARRDDFPGWGRDPSQERRPTDIEVKLNSLGGLTPFAHSGYYKINSVQRRIADETRRLVERP